MFLKKYVTKSTIEGWNLKKLSIDMRWVEIVKHFEKNYIPFTSIIKVVEFMMCLPGTSAPVERIFSLVNKVWTDEKTRLSFDTLNEIIKVKYNITLSCDEFFNVLKADQNLLRKIISTDKYNFKS